ncbi:MAG: glycosyl hydrolase family 28-related protein [Verrucomicrobiota bacterium]
MKYLLAGSIGYGLAVACLQPLAAAPAKQPVLDDTYLRYVSPTVKGPFPDLVNLEIPGALEDQRLATLGYVDVTKSPFNADPTGKKDSTSALQAAANFARDHQMVCFFPSGDYRISDTLSCIQQLYRRSNGRVLGGHLFPNLLVGSRAGAQRPRLILAPRSVGFSDPQKPKYTVYFWARGYLNPTTAGRVGDGLGPETEQPNISMNQMLVNLDIVIGEGNPGAIALRHQAAEGSAIEDCTIDATHGLIGIQGGIGSGGSSAGVTIIGGRIGLDFTGYMSGTQPTPVITGFTLRGQTEAAIRSTSRQTLVAAGLRIIADRSVGPLIQVGENLSANQGQLTLVDGEIVFEGETLQKPNRVAVASDCGVYLNNVYVRNATKVVRDAKQKVELAGNPNGWLRVEAYAHTSSPRPNQGVEYRYPVYADGQRIPEWRRVEPDKTPPDGLQARHLWRPDFPNFESKNAANVKSAPYHAKGDGVADDTDALQRAIDQSEIVMLPKGCYRISRTLELKPRTKLIGAGQHLSFVVATATGAFADSKKPAPLVRTADTAEAETILAFLGLFAARDIAGAQALHWRSGGRSVFRGVEIQEQSIYGFAPRPRNDRASEEPRTQPPVLITGHGGGNWYNYRGARLVVDGAQGPLHFYQFSPQQVTSELRSARQVSIFGTKYEGNKPMLAVSDCDQIRCFGHGGNGKGRATASLFIFERTPNFLFANGVDGPTKVGSKSLSHPEGSTDPNEWHLLIERGANGTEFKLPPLERPVLYQRGAPAEHAP